MIPGIIKSIHNDAQVSHFKSCQWWGLLEGTPHRRTVFALTCVPVTFREGLVCDGGGKAEKICNREWELFMRLAKACSCMLLRWCQLA